MFEVRVRSAPATRQAGNFGGSRSLDAFDVQHGLGEQIVERLQLSGQLHWRHGAVKLAFCKIFRADESIGSTHPAQPQATPRPPRSDGT